MTGRIGIAMLACLVLASPLRCWAQQTPEQKGRAIAEEADRRYGGYGDCTASLRMVLSNKQGQTSERQLRVRMLEGENGAAKSLCMFDSPADVKGTILLTHTRQGAQDDQWLFLPALERVKRIAAQNKSGSFMGSEYSYEDIATQTLDKFAYKWLRDEVYDGLECCVIERRPVDRRNSGYTRQVAWLDKEHLRMLKVDYHDRKDSLFKTLTFKDYERCLNKFWRPHVMTMENHQTGKSSQLIWSNLTFDTGLTDGDFNPQNLTRIR